jgi:hypothetical protein
LVNKIEKNYVFSDILVLNLCKWRRWDPPASGFWHMGRLLDPPASESDLRPWFGFEYATWLAWLMST